MTYFTLIIVAFLFCQLLNYKKWLSPPAAMLSYAILFIVINIFVKLDIEFHKPEQLSFKEAKALCEKSELGLFPFYRITPAQCQLLLELKE